MQFIAERADHLVRTEHGERHNEHVKKQLMNKDFQDEEGKQNECIYRARQDTEFPVGELLLRSLLRLVRGRGMICFFHIFSTNLNCALYLSETALTHRICRDCLVELCIRKVGKQDVGKV